MDIWVICENDGTILSTHCLGCKAGLAESCSHIASVLFYLEATTRIHGKPACTQVKCSWILPTYVSEVPYARAKDIDFSSAKKLKEKLDQKIDNSRKPRTMQPLLVLGLHRPAHQRLSACSAHRRLQKRKWIGSMPNSTGVKLKE